MKTQLFAVMAITAVLTMTTTTWAQGLDSLDAGLPVDGPHVSLPDDDFEFTFGLYQPAKITVSSPVLNPPPGGYNTIREADGNDELETFDAVLTGGLTGQGAGPVTLTGPVQVRVTDRNLSTTGLFDTEIVSMSLSGSAPDGTLIEIREDPNRASTGETNIDDLGGGLYHIESFFDVFTELSVDGGNSWITADAGVHMYLTPAPGTLGLLVLGGLAILRRRRKQ
jgi:hypothetical protein